MKLVTFAVAGRDRVGAVVDTHVVDLNAACDALLAAGGDPASAVSADHILPADMLGFIRGGADALAAAREAMRFAGERGHDVAGAVSLGIASGCGRRPPGTNYNVDEFAAPP